MISYGRQSIDEDDIAAVVETLRGDWLTQGPTIQRFEDAISDFTQAQHAVAFSSGTAALHAAAYAAGLGPGSLAYTSPLTFMATANAARYVGASPRLIDIDSRSLNLDLRLLPCDADAVLPVHYAGLPVGLEQAKWTTRPKVVIEDAAHALGALSYSGPVGNCANSDMTIFSFHPVKPVTTGEGGMVTTNNAELADRLRLFRNHGIVRRPEKDPWYYEISTLGMHYRMTDFQAALGLSQLKKLGSFIERRNEIAVQYQRGLSELEDVALPPEAPPGVVHGYHLYPIRVKARRELFQFLLDKGISPQVHYVPIHHHTISKDIPLPPAGLPNTEKAYQELISLPIYPGLSRESQSTVISAIKKFFSGA